MSLKRRSITPGTFKWKTFKNRREISTVAIDLILVHSAHPLNDPKPSLHRLELSRSTTSRRGRRLSLSSIKRMTCSPRPFRHKRRRPSDARLYQATEQVCEQAHKIDLHKTPVSRSSPHRIVKDRNKPSTAIMQVMSMLEVINRTSCRELRERRQCLGPMTSTSYNLARRRISSRIMLRKPFLRCNLQKSIMRSRPLLGQIRTTDECPIT